jgi:cell division septation protein DedD
MLAPLFWLRPGYGEGGTITSPDSAGEVGYYTSLALDGSGYPVVSYHTGDSADLKVLHCNDPSCIGGDESITSPDTGGAVGDYSSLALDAGGNPVISYYDYTNADLKVLHCNDPNCGGGDDTIALVDADGDVGKHASLVLDASGNPVISYYDLTNGDLKVLRCNDPDCSGGDEGMTAPDSAGVVGVDTSLALDGAGNPVVSYQDGTNGDLKVLHCDDPNCLWVGNSITSPDTAGVVGGESSLVLDGAGNPVVSYYEDIDLLHGNLKVLHCNDPNCSGDDESITSPDTGGDVGKFTSLALDGAGNPVVSYYDRENGDLKVLHCNDPNCAGGDESIISPDTGASVGTHNSLALDGAGNPVVSYYNATSGDLQVLHCSNANCSDVKPTPTPTDTPEPTLASTPTDSATVTPTSTPTASRTATETATPTHSATPTQTPTHTSTPSPTATPTPSATPVAIGDVDCNSTANSIDAALILQYGAGLVDSLPCQDGADVNEDGTINSIDASLILQYDAGLIPRLRPRIGGRA